MELEVIEAIESPEGKWPNALGNVILIDGNAFIQEIADNLRN